MNDTRPLILINDMPLAECDVSGNGEDGAEYVGFDPQRRRVTIWLHPSIMPGSMDDETPSEIMERIAYAEPGDRLPKLENTALPAWPKQWDCGCRHPGVLGGDCDGSCQHPPPGYEEPEPPVFVFPPAPKAFRMPWEK